MIICIKAERIDLYLLKSQHGYYPLYNTGSLKMIPFFVEYYFCLQKIGNQYKLLNWLKK